MPRNLNLGASTLRNRNRVTNKTRLKIVEGNVDADPIILDDDEEKAKILSTAGVDAEDANEHHLQEVLSAHQGIPPRGRSGSVSQPAAPAAYIPTPDSTGIVDNYEELYQPNRWIDPAVYVRTSETIDVFIENGLNDGFTYYMDERDKEWLDRNNEEARGEGTSAFGALSLSPSGAVTRSGGSARSAKARGKEPEQVQPVVIDEDQFELVMGVFEKVTHEKTPFLHHAVAEGQAFPSFTDYQDAFSEDLPESIFTSFNRPAWASPSTRLMPIARVIYPWWKERRVEREGHRIIPTLNFDESDIQNESYICFRHRELKAIRKTRAQHSTPSEKIVRLRSEMDRAIEIAQAALQRETVKQDLSKQSKNLWHARLPILDLKRQYPGLGTKEDEELLIDKERVKRIKIDPKIGIKIRRDGVELVSPTVAVEAIHPRERAALIQAKIDKDVAAQKADDHHWEDAVDNPYQPLPAPYGSRLFKYIPPPTAFGWPPSSSNSSDSDDNMPVRPRAMRLRVGRGGRFSLDRNMGRTRSRVERPSITSSLFQSIKTEDDENEWRLKDRWKFDADDEPLFGQDGQDEQDRVFIDDYDAKYLRYSIMLFSNTDSDSTLTTDPSLIFNTADGHQQAILPMRPSSAPNRAGPRQYPPGYVPPISAAGQQAATPVSVATPIKKLQQPVLRISNGGMRPPQTPQTPQTQHVSPPNSSAGMNGASPPGVNGIAVNGVVNRTPEKPGDVLTAHNSPQTSTPVVNGITPIQAPQTPQTPEVPAIPEADVTNSITPPPLRPKSQNQQHIPTTTPVVNGYHIASLNGFQSIPNGMNPFLHPGLSHAQVANLKNAFTNPDMSTALANSGRLPAQYLANAMPNGVTYNMQGIVGANMQKLAGARAGMQWSGSPQPRPAQLDGSMSPSPNMGHALPVRTPSRMAMIQGANGQLTHSLSPHMHNASPLPTVPTHPSPHRPPQPNMMTSPSLQHQQAVTQGGY